MKRQKQNGADSGGCYTYYDIISYEFCLGCPNMTDNKYEERFECDIEDCPYYTGLITEKE